MLALVMHCSARLRTHYRQLLAAAVRTGWSARGDQYDRSCRLGEYRLTALAVGVDDRAEANGDG
jgi:hypothetical protein